MKLPVNQLSSHLERGLAAVYLIASDEPLLVAEAGDEIRRAALQAGFTERSTHFVERGFHWDSLQNDADSLSLFAEKRIIEIRMAAPKPGDAGSKAIRALAEERDPDRIVIISIQSRLDRSTANAVWVRTVEKHGVLVEIRPVTRRDLPAFLGRRARRHGLRLGADAAELLADRVEGNLLAADQELIKLALIAESATVGTDAVLESVATSARFDVFRFSEALVAGDAIRAMTVLDGLESEGAQPALVLWALVRELMLLAELKHGEARGRSLGQLMTDRRIWRSREPALRRALARFSLAELVRLMRRAAAVDRAVKGQGRMPPWEAVGALTLEMLAPRERSTA